MRHPWGVSRIVAVSPDLGDAVLSCGGALARHAAQGDEVVLLTVFSGPADDEVWAARRAEDQRAAATLGLSGAVHAGLPETTPGAEGAGDVAAAVLGVALDGLRPDLVLSPLGAGDGPHSAVVEGALATLGAGPRVRWLDVPGVFADPEAADAALQGAGGRPVLVPVADTLARKLDACACYASRVADEFGGEQEMREAIVDLAERCATILDAPEPVELLVGPPAA